MSLNLEEGITIKIDGELGKNQTLPIDSLIKIAQSLQALVMSIAQYDLPSDEAVDLSNFKLELSDFNKGSAIPTFILTKNIQHVTTSNLHEQRNHVSKKLSKIFEVCDSGEYANLKELYPEFSKRNPIVSELYNFSSSFNDSPVSIYDTKNKQVVYSSKKFKAAAKDRLLVQVVKPKDEPIEESAFARIKITKTGGKTRNKIEEIVLPQSHSLSYSPDVITSNDKKYTLRHPLRCLSAKELDYYVIQNEIFDLIGTGENEEEAEKNFNEEFDFLYNRLLTLADNKLSPRLQKIKSLLIDLVTEINPVDFRQKESIQEPQEKGIHRFYIS